MDPPVTIGLKRYKVDKHIYLPSLVFSWMMVVKVFKKINCFDRLDLYNVLNLDIAVNWNTLEYPPYNRLNLQEAMKGMKNLEELNFNLDKEICCSNYQVSKILELCPIFLIIQPFCQKVRKIKMKMQCSCDFSVGRGINVICKSRYFNLLIGQINEKMPNIKNIYIFNRHPRNSHVSQKKLLVDDIFDIVNNKVLSEGTFTPRLF